LFGCVLLWKYFEWRTHSEVVSKVKSFALGANNRSGYRGNEFKFKVSMEIKRKFEDVEITFNLTDDEVIDLIATKSLDERVVFFRKLFETDIANTFPFNLMKKVFKNA